jgi:hypothetical protein
VGVGNIEHGRDLVVVEVGVDHLAGLAVEDPLLGDAEADPHGHAAEDLIVEGEPVEHPARVVRAEETEDPDLTGAGVDLDLAELSAERGLVKVSVRVGVAITRSP